MSTYHIPIMVDDVVRLLNPDRGGVFVDGTLGGGGHAEAVLDKLPSGSRLFGIDRDGAAIDFSSQRLKKYGDMFTAIRGNFFDIKDLLSRVGIETADGILLDLGVSSFLLDTPGRGFAYHHDAPLDMRMDDRQELSARAVVNEYEPSELARIFSQYGEERYAKRIAAAIARERDKKPIDTTAELAEIIKSATPADKRYEGKHPARRVFQAIRIEVNAELCGLKQALMNAHSLLNPGGKLVCLTFHSLEDRIVKQAFRELENPCACPSHSPVCVCGKKPQAKSLTKKPVIPSDEELLNNARSRSCKLRAIERI